MDPRIPKYIRSSPFVTHIIDAVNHNGFSSLDTDEKKIEFTLPFFKSFLQCSPFAVSNKSLETAIAIREKGNHEFISNLHSNLDNIIAIYTKSIAFSPEDSEALAVGYANRSAALFKARAYDSCLLDIDRALKSVHYPDKLRAKLHARKAKCLFALKRSAGPEFRRAVMQVSQWLNKMDLKDPGRPAILAFTRNPTSVATHKDAGKPQPPIRENYSPVISDENALLPGVSARLEMKHSDMFGRHFLATRNIKPGDVLGVQKPYAKVVCPDFCYKLCWHCAKQIRAGIPCKSCAHAVFCDDECRNSAWREYHDVECPIIPYVDVKNVDHVFLMGLRLSILAMKEAGGIDGVKAILRQIDRTSDLLIKGFMKGVMQPSKFSSVSGLIHHAEKRSAFAQFWWCFSSLFIALLVVQKIESMSECLIADLLYRIDPEELISVATLIFRNMQIAASNGFFVTADKYGQQVNRYFAITPAFSLFNHSCHPSAGFHDFSDKLAVYALTSIKAGDQVFINYGCDFLSNTRNERQEKLKIEYCFKCNCIACDNDWTIADCRSYQKQDLSLIGRATINELLAEKDKTMRIIFNESLEGINFPSRISKLVDSIVCLKQHARSPCKELIDLEKSLNRAFRFYGNRYLSLD